jgi:hypothetical protein
LAYLNDMLHHNQGIMEYLNSWGVNIATSRLIHPLPTLVEPQRVKSIDISIIFKVTMSI